MGDGTVGADAMGESKADGGPEPDRPAASPEPAGERRPRRRRFFLGKAGAAWAALLTGALLGGGFMAWQADAPPFFDDRPCWGALTEADLSDLPLGQERIVAEELPPRGPAPERATCRLTGYEHETVEWTVTIRMHTPGGESARHVTAWPEKFLLSDMVPLGQDLPGMASRARAWLLMPDGCGWSSGGLGTNPPMLVDVDAGNGRVGYRDGEGTVRTALARVAVHAANAAMDSMECDVPRYDEPGELAPVPQAHEVRAENLCGIKGLTMPDDLRKSMALETARHNGSTNGPARVCALGTFLDDARFVTIANPALAEFFYSLSLTPEHRTEGDGIGRIGTALSIIWAPCKDGHRAFVLRSDSASTEDDLAFSRAMFPKYVASEAERIGCGDVSVTLRESER